MKKELTDQQKKVYEFIAAFIKIRGFPPCLQEVATGLNMKSRSNIHRIVAELKKKGYVSSKPLLARTIRVR